MTIEKAMIEIENSELNVKSQMFWTFETIS
jgi:hypothetical protein